MKPAPKKRNVIQLRPIYPNAGVAAAYKRALRKILQEIHADVAVEVIATYAANQANIAQDAKESNASKVMQELFKKLNKKWTDKLDKQSIIAAQKFVKSAQKHTEVSFRDIAEEAGMTVDFQMSERVEQTVDAAVHENVALIKDLGGDYINGIEQAVFRSIAAGHDMGQLTKVLQNEYGMSQRRAAFIAADQNNKAKAIIERERRLENGFTKAKWLHSSAGKRPRATHVKMDGEEFDIEKGMYDPAVDEWIQPGQLINCRCSSVVVFEF